MSSRYQKQFTIPEGFPQLLKTFSREVLRCQPPNIYKFGARYFAQLVEARQAEAEEAMGQEERSIYDMTLEELQDFCMDLFLEFDSDQNGYLDRKEFKAVVQTAKLGLGSKEIRRVMAEADEDGNGHIEYREFLPLMVDIIHNLKAKETAAQARMQEERDVREEVEHHLLHGIPREELEAVMRSVFEMADEDGNGNLSREEFRHCLKSAELGLTRKEINLLLSECDYDHDGNISYQEFVPLCFNILVERFKDQVLSSQALQSSDQLQLALLSAFNQYDTEGTGYTSVGDAKRSLQAVSEELLGLTRLQILSIMSESNPNPEGRVEYAQFSRVAADMIYTLVDLDSQAQRIKAINQLALTEGADLLHGLNADTVKQVMLAAFKEADVDESGTLDGREVMDVLQAMGTGSLQLQQYEVNALIAAVDADMNGKVEYVELIDFMYEVLSHLNREKFVQDQAYETSQEQ
eukprot:CAMPEP_0196587910 /NCGR_PEP_ID=MMETSP1081-20130531/58985_1 /TAXON_ID=36882 /ORGANISM="Pyramimonas amylifera, Strain CCMP720" /LENGTH=463 /DNA_ID=CAMNT_0041910241 /DNA_START=329 /DNA_END=1720 /DNA_ORIENTATION=-